MRNKLVKKSHLVDAGVSAYLAAKTIKVVREKKVADGCLWYKHSYYVPAAEVEFLLAIELF